MNDLKKYIAAGCLSVMLCLPAGCNEYAQKKQVIVNQWEESTALAQLPIIAGQIEQGRLKQAKESLNKCLQALPESAQAHYLSGRIHEIEGRYDKARQAYQKAVELDPQIAAAWHSLGSLAVLKKDNPLALECYQKAYQLEPLKTEYLLSLSDLYMETQQPDKAEAILKDGLAQQPRNLELILTLAGLCRQRGDTDQAVVLYRQGLLLHGKDPQILEPCGYLYISLERWTEAEEMFKPLVDSYPKDSDSYALALRALALCSFNAGRYAQAMNHYDKLSVLCRDDADIWLKMAQSALGSDNPQRAGQCAEKALRLQPAWPAAYAVLGSAQYLQNQYDKAVSSFSHVTDDGALAGYAWFMTGRCYQKLGQTIQANAAFEKSERINPSSDLVTTFLKRSTEPL